MPKTTDSVIFSETEREILERALQNPELSNAEIAAETGLRITLVRDTRQQYEEDVELAEDVADSDSETADSEAVTIDGADLSETQQAILETVATNPTMMNADIAAETGARITLVRDTIDQYGDAVDTTAGSEDSDEDDSEAADTVSEPNDTQAVILELAAENPDMTNADIAAETGARITLVRDTLDTYDGSSGAVGADADAAGGSAAVDDADGFSEIQLEILEVALDSPDLTNGEIAAETGARITLVRDTIADYQSDDEPTEAAANTESSGEEIPSEIDTEAFSETQIEILQTALANPELTNGEIAAETGTRITLVRDTIHDHEYDQKPWDKDLDDETEPDSEDDETEAATPSTETIEMPETTNSDLLSAVEQAILETALENPELTNGEIAEQVGARLTLVRDTRATYEQAVDLADDSEETADTEPSQTAPTAEPSERQREILEAVADSPDLTNGEIAAETGARITLVRDTRAQYEDEIDLADSSESSSGESTDSTDSADEVDPVDETDAADPAAESGGSNAGLVVGILLALLLVIGVAAGLGVI